MARHKEPKILEDYRDNKYPRICHTCEQYNQDGMCLEFKAEPPEDFAATHDACDKYDPEIPF